MMYAAMGRESMFGLLILAFLQTGKSNSKISIHQSSEGPALVVCCNLSGEDRVSQINWDKVKSSNRSMVGIFNPHHGTHIFPEYNDSVKIEGHSSFRSTTLILSEPDVGNGTEYCCVFVAFPSGTIEQCMELAAFSGTVNTRVDHAQQMSVLLMLLFLIPFFTLLLSVFLCWRHFGRRQVFQVQTDLQTGSEESFEEPTEIFTPSDTPDTFDPSKLYTKIVVDGYYGRLWKACQAASRSWAPLPQHCSQKIYYLLGEHPVSRKEKDQEDLLHS